MSGDFGRIADSESLRVPQKLSPTENLLQLVADGESLVCDRL